VGKSTPRKILCVDDDPVVRRVVVRALRWRGHECSEANGVREGIELALANTPDLIIADYNMGDGTGLAFVRELRELLRDAMPPVILASAALEYIDAAAKAEFAAAHRKPIVLSKLLDDVDRLTVHSGAKKASVRRRKASVLGGTRKRQAR
jgi:CheY-like chemotaxis protein